MAENNFFAIPKNTNTVKKAVTENRDFLCSSDKENQSSETTGSLRPKTGCNTSVVNALLNGSGSVWGIDREKHMKLDAQIKKTRKFGPKRKDSAKCFKNIMRKIYGENSIPLENIDDENFTIYEVVHKIPEDKQPQEQKPLTDEQKKALAEAAETAKVLELTKKIKSGLEKPKTENQGTATTVSENVDSVFEEPEAENQGTATTEFENVDSVFEESETEKRSEILCSEKPEAEIAKLPEKENKEKSSENIKSCELDKLKEENSILVEKQDGNLIDKDQVNKLAEKDSEILTVVYAKASEEEVNEFILKEEKRNKFIDKYFRLTKVFKGLKRTQNFFLNMLRNMFEDVKACFMTNACIAKKMHCSRKHASKTLSELRKAGYIQIHLEYDAKKKKTIRRVIALTMKARNYISAVNKAKNKSVQSVIFEDLGENYGLNNTQKEVFGYIYTLSQKQGYCWATNRVLSNLVGCSKRHFIRILKFLKELGLCKTNIFFKENSKEVDVRAIIPLYGYKKKCSPIIAEDTEQLKNMVMLNRINHAKKKVKQKKEKTFKEEFMVLWLLYPKKKNKRQALRAYIKARERGVSKKEIEDGFKKYLVHLKRTGVDEKYIAQGGIFFEKRKWALNWGYKKPEEKKPEQKYDFQKSTSYNIDEYLDCMDTFAEPGEEIKKSEVDYGDISQLDDFEGTEPEETHENDIKGKNENNYVRQKTDPG